MDMTSSELSGQRLDATKRIIVGGAGPYGLTAALALTERLGAEAPAITLIEPCSLDPSSHWEPCKGCAGGILLSTLEHLAAAYDHQHHVAFAADGITMQTAAGLCYLSRCQVDEVAFHLPHELPLSPPVVRFRGSEVVVPTFRMGGPRDLHGEWLEAHSIGFSPFLYSILTANNPRVDVVPGRMRMVDTDGERPVVVVHGHDGEKRVEGDHVLITTGLSKSRPPLLKAGGVVHEMPRVQVLRTLMMSAKVPSTPETQRIFNVRPGPITRFRAHLFVTDGPAHYILTMPKVVGHHVALTVATFGQEGEAEVDADDVVTYLSQHPAFRRAGLHFQAPDTYCHCGAFIPSSTLPAEQQYGRGYSLGGDIAGGLRLWKNGIGTAIGEAERFAAHLATHGTSPEVLGAYMRASQQRITADNGVGRGLLHWVDLMLGHEPLSELLQIYLKLEQRLPGSQQWLLRVFGATTTGQVPYVELLQLVRSGVRGRLLELFAGLIRTPLPAAGGA